jgi:hypothetical protein
MSSGFDFGPPPPISSDNVKIKRVVGQDGKVRTEYVDSIGKPLGLQPQQHHQGVSGNFEPPPAEVAVIEAEQILASS